MHTAVGVVHGRAGLYRQCERHEGAVGRGVQQLCRCLSQSRVLPQQPAYVLIIYYIPIHDSLSGHHKVLGMHELVHSNYSMHCIRSMSMVGSACSKCMSVLQCCKSGCSASC